MPPHQLIRVRRSHMRVTSTLCVLAAVFCICATSEAVSQPARQTTQPPDLHNSKNSLDWAGTYEGVLPCADCPGIKTRLTLNKNGTYELRAEFLDRPIAPKTVRGRFTWHASGNAISLDATGGRQQWAVGEGHLAPLNLDGTRVNAPDRMLRLVP